MQLSSSFVRKLDKLAPELRETIVSFAEEIEESPRKSDFDELKGIVKELAAAQKRTELRLEELAEAQNRTESRVEELAAAQKRTELRLEELAKAQNRTELRVEELAGAQKRTEREIATLTRTVKDIQKQVGGLAMVVGYGIEDRLMPYVFDFGKKVFGIDVNIVDRRNIVYSDGTYDEVNIYGEGFKAGRQSYIIGECKPQPGKKDFDRFSGMLKRIENELTGDVYPFIVGYHFAPEVEVYAGKKYPAIKYFRTFEIEMKYDALRNRR